MAVNKPLPPNWKVLGDNIVEQSEQCNCGMGSQGTYYGHESYCGLDYVMTVAEFNAKREQG